VTKNENYFDEIRATPLAYNESQLIRGGWITTAASRLADFRFNHQPKILGTYEIILFPHEAAFRVTHGEKPIWRGENTRIFSEGFSRRLFRLSRF
jgi:hypothetical protein